MKRTPTLIAALLSCSLLSTAAMADIDLSSRALSVEQATLWNVAPQAPQTITPRISFDRASPVYRVGEQVRFSVTVDRPAYVIVLNTAPDGTITQLYPVRNQPQRQVQPGALLQIPGNGLTVVAREPAGRDTLTVYASSVPVSLEEFFQNTGGTFRSAAPGSASGIARKLEIVAATPVAPSAPAVIPQPVTPVTSVIGVQPVLAPAVIAQPVAPVQPSYGLTKVTLDTISSSAYAPAEPVGRPVVVQAPVVVSAQPVQTVSVLPQPVTPVSVAPITATPSNAFTLSVNVDKQNYRVGEPVRVNVNASRPCHLTLLSYSSTGRSGKVFPSHAGQDTRIPAGSAVSLPGVGSLATLTALNAGQERLVALCSETKRDLVGTPTAINSFIRTGNVQSRDLALVYGAPVPNAPGSAVAQAETFFNVY